MKKPKVYRATIRAAVKGWALYAERGTFPTEVSIRKPDAAYLKPILAMGFTLERVTILRG